MELSIGLQGMNLLGLQVLSIIDGISTCFMNLEMCLYLFSPSQTTCFRNLTNTKTIQIPSTRCTIDMSSVLMVKMLSE